MTQQHLSLVPVFPAIASALLLACAKMPSESPGSFGQGSPPLPQMRRTPCTSRPTGTVSGSAIYRTVYSAGAWQAPTLVLQGQVGEPTLPADGSVMYFVHVLTDTAQSPVFGADVYYVERK